MPSRHSHNSKGVFQSLSALLILLSLLFSSAAAALPLQGASTNAPAAASPAVPALQGEPAPQTGPSSQSRAVQKLEPGALDQAAALAETRALQQQRAAQAQGANAARQGAGQSQASQLTSQLVEARYQRQSIQQDSRDPLAARPAPSPVARPATPAAAPSASPLPNPPAYQVTLETLHRNTHPNANSSTFSFTNDSQANVADISLDFYWPNDELAASEQFSIAPGGSYTYVLANSPTLPGMWAGKVVISSAEPVSGQILSPDYGLISGRVFQSDGVTPLAGVYLNTRNWPDNNQDYGGANSLNDGSYFIAGLADGSYMLDANPGYPWAKQWYNGKSERNQADPLAISAAADLLGIDFVLQPGGQIEGTVYAEDGVTPLANLNVDLAQGDFGTCTDANGHYAITGVPFGEHKLVAATEWNWCINDYTKYLTEFYDNVPSWDQATPVAVNPGQDIVSGIDFSLETGGSISGQVVAAAGGAPLELINIHVRDFNNGSIDRNTWTALDGTYFIGGLPDGAYMVVAEDYNGDAEMWAKEFYPESDTYQGAGQVVISGSNALSGIDFTLEPGGSIAGRVVDAQTGLPLANINVDLEQGWWGTCSDADGYYYMPSVHFGDQYLVAARDWNWCLNQPNTYVQEYYEDVFSFDQATPVQVASGDPFVTGIDFDLAQGGTISGQVTGPGGAPLASIRVSADPYDGGNWGRGVYTAADGSYTISGLPDGDYRIEARDEDSNAPYYAREWYDDTYRWDQAARVAVSGGGATAGIDFDLSAGGLISGNIVDQVSSLPLANICLSANLTDGSSGEGTCTDSQGDYTFFGLPFGEYEVIAAGADRQWQGANDYAQEFYPEALYRWDATPVSIGPGAESASGIDFTLEHGGYITGHVQDESGQPVANVRMAAQVSQPWCQDCSEWYDSVSTDANGDYKLGPLPAIEVAVYACVDCAGITQFYNEYYNDAISFLAAERLQIIPPTTLDGIDFTLNQGWLINGAVSVPAGFSAEGFQVDVYRNDEPSYGAGCQTDANGHYQVAVPPITDQAWAIRVAPRGTSLGGGRVERVEFAEQTTWDFDLQPGGSISGRVTSGGAPVSNAFVHAWSVWYNDGTNTDAQGYFTIANLPAGAYDLTIDHRPEHAWQNYHGLPWHDYHLITLATGQDVSGLEIAIQPGGRIEGHVYEADGVTPLENIAVFAIQDNNYWTAWTDPAGYYTMDLEVGPTQLYFKPESGETYNPVYYPGVESFDLATPVNVPAISSGTLVVNQNLERYATLSGQVINTATGQGQGGIHVAALNIDPTVGLELFEATCTDGDGHYQIQKLTPGQTRIYTTGACGADEFPTTTRTLNLAPNTNHSLNISLAPGTPPEHRLTYFTYLSTPFAAPLDNNAINQPVVPALFAPLAAHDLQGTWYSDLLTQVPTVENGGAQVVNNQLVVSYSFKPGLMWSDGQPLTSADLAFTWELLTRPSPFLGQEAGYAPIFEIVSVDASNPLVAVVTYRAGVFYPHYLEAFRYLLPEHLLASANPHDLWASAYQHQPVGNGPYIIEEWVPGSHLDLRANPNYARRVEGLPRSETLRILTTGDPYHALQRGLVDVIEAGDPAWDLSGSGASLHQHAANTTMSVIPNTEHPLFQDPAVRKALYQALDRPAIVNLYAPYHLEAISYAPPSHPLYGGNVPVVPFDLSAAAAGLTAAGWSDHNGNGIRDKNGREFDFNLYIFDGSQWRLDIAKIFQADLASIGVSAHIISVPRDDYFEKGGRGDYEMWMIGWQSGPTYDPDGYEKFHTSNIPNPANAYNGWYSTGRWSDATNDAILEALYQELSQPTLKSLYAQHFEHWTTNLPNWPVYHATLNPVARDILTGFEPDGLIPTTWNVQDWYLPPNPYDLSVRKTLSLASPAAQPGATIEYSLSVSNLGYFGVTNAVLFDSLPGNLSYVSASPVPSSVNGQNIQWNLGNLVAGQTSATILLRAKVSDGAQHGDPLQNNAQVWMDEIDSHPENNGVVHSLTVREDIDLAIDKYGVGQPAVGEQYSYYLNVSNQGGAPAKTVTVTDTLPPEVTYLDASPQPDLVNGKTLTWNLASLAGGQYGQQIHIQAEIDATGTVTNQAAINSPDADVNPSNNQDSASETVAAILSPVILRPTGGVTDGTPLVSGTAPSGSTVRIYDVKPATPVLRATVTADSNGHFQATLNLPEGGYILSATAEKAGLTSSYSNQAAITVDHDLPLDPDQLSIRADGVDVSLGCVQAERRLLPYAQLDISAVIHCIGQPDAQIRIVENGSFTYTSAPVQVINLGGGAWQVDFRAYLGEAHSNYQIFLEWECGGLKYSVLLLYILVDPDGFLYDATMVAAGVPMEEALIMNGTVTAYVKNGDQWQVWPANLYGQVNPQQTDGASADGVLTPGYYSFLTPSGQYRIEASAPGYLDYQSPVITVLTTPVRLDIGLTPISAGVEAPLTPANLAKSSLSADKEPVYASDLLTYTIVLDNSGQIASDPLSLSDPLPDGTIYQPGTLSLQGGGTASYDSAQDRIVWQGSLPANGSVQIQFQVRVAATPGGPTSLTNQASLSGSAANLLSAPLLKAVTSVVRKDFYLPVINK